MDISLDTELAIRLLISFAIGTAIGLEREYRSKAAGLRTMIMICVGSTVFTEISIAMGGATPDRIASNIVTGVGFLGAGVIFKDGLNVSGLTTATTIWISAALGMAVGAGEYFIAIVTTGVVVLVLSLFNYIQEFVERLHHARVYRICFGRSVELAETLNAWLVNQKLRHKKKKLVKERDQLVLVYEIYGSEKKLDEFSRLLQQDDRVISYEF
ncbi:MAG: MgtC/SapB family protein [Cyclobacteriaceae bacterium]|jgi:putative Mg2+ transporter-C (MgtC) family protein